MTTEKTNQCAASGVKFGQCLNPGHHINDGCEPELCAIKMKMLSLVKGKLQGCIKVLYKYHKSENLFQTQVHICV